jgi:hypothetical protein
MAQVKAKVKTKPSALKYCFIKGEGRNQEIDNTKPANMCFTATAVVPKDSEAHKDIVAQLEKVWEAYKKEEPKAKGTLKTSAIKDEMIRDPKGTIDPETDEVKRVPTGNVVISMYTKTTWADGKPKTVKKYLGTADITTAYDNEDWSIGEGSTGIIHGMAVGNTGGGNAKITLYLSAVQIGKLVKYEGDDVELDELEAEGDIDVADTTTESSETPDL